MFFIQGLFQNENFTWQMLHVAKVGWYSDRREEIRRGAARRDLAAPLLKLALNISQAIGQEQILRIGISGYPPGEKKHSAMYKNGKAISTRITRTMRRISPTSCRVRRKLVFP